MNAKSSSTNLAVNQRTGLIWLAMPLVAVLSFSLGLKLGAHTVGDTQPQASDSAQSAAPVAEEPALELTEWPTSLPPAELRRHYVALRKHYVELQKKYADLQRSSAAQAAALEAREHTSAPAASPARPAPASASPQP